MPPGRFLSRRNKFKILAVSGALLLGLAASEVFLRLINYRPAVVDPNIYVANQSDILPYKLRPNYDGYYLGQEVKVDADGYRVVTPNSDLRGRMPKDGEGTTIVILGDSMVFGYGLRNEDTIASQLQNQVLKRNLDYRIKNIGAPGYSSWNEYAALEEYLTKYKADRVLLTYNINDLTFNNDYFEIGKGRQAAFSDDRFHRFIQFVYSRVYTAYLLADTTKKIYARLNGNLKGVSTNDNGDTNNLPALDYSMEALNRIKKLCDAHSIRFSVGIYRDVVVHSRSPDKSLAFEELVKQNLEQRGIKSFLIKSHVDNLTPSAAKVFWNDPHPSPKAVGFIVADMMKELE